LIRVLLNDRALSRTLTGVGNYIAQLLLHLPEHEPDIRVDPFYHARVLRRDWRRCVAPSEQPAAAAPPHHPRDISASRYPWWLRRLLQQSYAALFRWSARRYRLYHEPNHIPIRCDLPTVTTIHDLSGLTHPEWHPADRVRWYEREFHAGLRQSRRFIAASEFTRQEMVTRLGVRADHVFVTYQAPRAAFRPVDHATLSAARAALTLPERFFLYVGTLEPRKNVPGLLEAYAALPPDVRCEHPLLIAGAWGWKQQALREKLERHHLGNQVRLLGYMHDPSLACLYSLCTALVWPTWFEGFGLPPLEAMACGAPVVTSAVTSLPEVVGEAGILLDPHDTAAWTSAMRRLADDPDLRAELGRRGLVRASAFTWERFCRSTAAAYRSTLDS
jgi:glycosyltransferase involved in cell wall biosynthesis